MQYYNELIFFLLISCSSRLHPAVLMNCSALRRFSVLYLYLIVLPVALICVRDCVRVAVLFISFRITMLDFYIYIFQKCTELYYSNLRFCLNFKYLGCMEMQSKPDYIKILASIIVFLLHWIKCILGNDPNSATVLVLHSKHKLNVSFILMKRFHH